MKKKMLYLYICTALAAVSCIPLTVTEEDTEKLTILRQLVEPARFSIENAASSPLMVYIKTGTIPSRNAKYSEFEILPEKLFSHPDDLTAVKRREHGLVYIYTKLHSAAWDEPHEQARWNFIKDKYVTFVLEISDGTNTVRVAGWDLPETEWTANNIAAAGWGVWHMADWKADASEAGKGSSVLDEKFPHPRFYTVFKAEAYPEHGTNYSITVKNLKDKTPVTMRELDQGGWVL